MRTILKEKAIAIVLTGGFWLAASNFCYGLAVAKDLRAITPEQNKLLQVKVHRLIIDPGSQQPVVILADAHEERGLFIWISHFEANAIHSEMNGIEHFRPLTHDLMERVMERANIRIQRVIVTHIHEGVYYATLVLKEGKSVIEIDARPSDSIVMALKFKAPVFVSESLFKKASVPLKEQGKVEESYGLRLQDLTPSLARAFSFHSTNGVLVSDVRKQSRAEKDGLERGDIIVEIGGRTVDGVIPMRNALKESKDPLQVMIFRKAQFMTITLHPN